MAFVPAAYAESAGPRLGRQAAGPMLAGRACKSFWISRPPCRVADSDGAAIVARAAKGSTVLGRVLACIFLLIPRRAATGPSAAAAWPSGVLGRVVGCIFLVIPRGPAPGPSGAAAWPGSVPGQVAACIFLLISRRAPWTSHGVVLRTPAAAHKSIVNNNENTSARRAVGYRDRAGTHWDIERNWRAGHACGAARGQNINPEQARRMPHGAGARFNPTGRRIVKACRSLLIHASRPPEPVRSGGSRARAHGHGSSCRPPSRPTESGGRR